ncbi:hypothetical protein NLI96_g10068 [Meripilus lineatus]|uniref:Uncharacterized protein n=1 Tax=Meripilus lineatus TaxID=2056292 RepID=A0AAD5UYT6_9APHY|nr:hypothetical protein NLI96_g10068 [Physisporinus lineatus]
MRQYPSSMNKETERRWLRAEVDIVRERRKSTRQIEAQAMVAAPSMESAVRSHTALHGVIAFKTITLSFKLPLMSTHSTSLNVMLSAHRVFSQLLRIGESQSHARLLTVGLSHRLPSSKASASHSPPP